MKLTSLGYALLSACAYSYSLMVPTIGPWLIIPALAGFIFTACRTGFLWGYAWGLIAFGIVLSDTAYTLYNLSQGESALCALPAILFIAYMPLYSGMAAKVIRLCYTHIRTTWISWLVIGLVSTGLWWCISYACLWITGVCEGCCILNPLLALVDVPLIAWMHQYISQEIVLFIINGMATMLAFCAIKSRAYAAAYYSFIMLIFLLPLSQHSQCPAWIKQILVVPQAHHITGNAHVTGHYLKRVFEHCLKQQPQIACIILPESAIYVPQEEMLEACISCWSTIEARIILGSFLHQNKHCYNACFAIRNGHIDYTHCKQHLMPFIERHNKTLWWSAQWYPHALEYGPKEQALLQLLPELTVIPALCSELFCQKSLPGGQRPILALCNDRWFGRGYTKELLFLTARLQAMRWQRAIIYASYSRNFFICPSGAIYPLLCA